jgi:DNA-binding NarL/FixJ family response regulator
MSDLTESIRVLISADDPLIRAGIRASTETFAYAKVIDEVPSLQSALARVRTRDVDALVACLPLTMDTAALSRFAEFGCAVVLLAEPDRRGQLLSSARAGVRRFVDKSSSSSELGRALVAAARGDAFLSPSFTGALLDWLDNRILSAERPPRVELASLSEREREVLELLGQARSNTEIARLLRIRETTVRSHVSNLLAKLHLRTRSEAVVVGYRQALLKESP